MFTNYIKIAIRNLWKNKGFSLLNIAGMAIGLGCFLLIALYVVDELSYDRFNEKADRIYRINSDIKFGGNELHIPQTSDLMGADLQKDYPEVERYTRVYSNTGSKLIRKGNEYINEPLVAYVDSSFFDVFTVPAIYGDPHKALYEPNTVVVSETAARKYFGTTDVVGKNIEIIDGTLYKIMAVTKDMPRNAHFRLDFFFSMKNVNYQWGQHLSHNFNTYLLLKKGADAAALEKKFPEYINRYVLPEAKQFMEIGTMDEFEKSGNSLVYSLMPLTKIHLYSRQAFELSPPGNIQHIYIFSAVAVFLLLIACINFINLTTARSASRAREVGIRKVLGTERKNLMAQFLIESTLTVILALLLAIGLAYLSLPLFNDIASKQMSLQSLFSPLLLPVLIVLPLVVGLLAGSYPAFYLSSFRPIVVLKGGKPGRSGKAGLRSALVVFQFWISIVLITGTIIVYRQLHYIQTRNLGYNKEQVLIINNSYALKDHVDAFKQDVLQMPGVITGSVSDFLPVSNSSRNDNSFSKEVTMDVKNAFSMQNWRVDYDYLSTMGMQLVKGRNFSKEFGTDSAAVIINETTASKLGYDDPLGKTIYRSANQGPPIPFHIIGVVRNFNFESLRQQVQPLGLFLSRSTGLVSFKLKPGNPEAVIKNIEAKWKTLAPGMPFSYRFLDDSFNEMYRQDQRAGKIAMIFSILAIFVACLGLFGLAAFVAEQRTKEIGIRKVLGASVNGLVQLLSRDFLVLVLVAFIIAVPFAWWAMNKWLEDFAYRINISWWIFLLAGFIALFIALVTVSFQAIRAALANPVKNLRNE